MLSPLAVLSLKHKGETDLFAAAEDSVVLVVGL